MDVLPNYRKTSFVEIKDLTPFHTLSLKVQDASFKGENYLGSRKHAEFLPKRPRILLQRHQVGH